MYLNTTLVGGDGASAVSVRGLVPAEAGKAGGRPDDWDEIEDGVVPDIFELGELDFDESGEDIQPVTPIAFPDDAQLNTLPQRAPAQPERKSARRTTDVGNAERFAEQHGADVRFCYEWDCWLVWDGRRWIVDGTGEIERRAKRTALSIYQEAANAVDKREREDLSKWAVTSERRERLNAMISLAQSEQPIPVKVESLDAERWLLNCENGTIDLKTGELRPPQRDDYLTKLCPVEYPTEPGIDPDRWLGFLDRIFGSNAQLIGFVRRLLGMSLVGEVREHLLPIFYGTGANGKSVFMETACGLLGTEYSMAAPHGFLIASKSDRHPTEVADLHGKRLVAATETDDGRRLSESLVKQLTGGDQLRARRMREDFWGFVPSHTVILATNHKPIVRGTDNGIWRRIKLVPFTVTIPADEQDSELKKKLEAEWPAILRWIVTGCIEWQREGLKEPKEVVEATDNYRTDMDVLGEFLKECCIRGEGCQVGATALYQAYRDWSGARGEFVETQTKFGTKLTERGLSKGFDAKKRVVYLELGLLGAYQGGPEGLEGSDPF